MFDDEQWLRDNGLFDIADPTDLYRKIVERRERGDDGIKAPVSKLDGLFSIPLRGVTILGAYSGTGKSTFASQWALHAANSGRKTAVMSLEMPSDFTLELMAEQSACLATPHLEYVERFAGWANGKIFLHNSTNVITPEAVLNFVRVSKTLLGCDFIVIDPLMQVGMPADIDAEKDFITRLASMARDYEVAVLLVHHLRKPPAGGQGEKQKPDKASFLGSTHLTGAAAAVITLWADPDKREARSNGEEPDDEKGPDYLFTVHKQRFAQWHGSVGLYQHDKARLLCNSRARMYRPVDLKDEQCETQETSITPAPTAFSQEATPGGFSNALMPSNTRTTGSTTNVTAFPSSKDSL
jgi:replicative DNA helicase